MITCLLIFNVVVKRRPGSWHTIHYLASSMKECWSKELWINCEAGDELSVYKKVHTTKDGKAYQDMENVCSKKASLLRKHTPNAMRLFTWGDLAQELEQLSLMFYHVLKDCVYRK